MKTKESFLDHWKISNIFTRAPSQTALFREVLSVMARAQLLTIISYKRMDNPLSAEYRYLFLIIARFVFQAPVVQTLVPQMHKCSHDYLCKQCIGLLLKAEGKFYNPTTSCIADRYIVICQNFNIIILVNSLILVTSLSKDIQYPQKLLKIRTKSQLY